MLEGNFAVLPTPGLANVTWPEWSSDGQWIYFHGEAATGTHVYRIRPDGTDLTNLTPGRNAAMPSPSPDGQRVVYVADRLVVQDLATGMTQALTGTEGARAPRWSPDGQWIAFTGQFSTLVLVRPDGTDRRTLTADYISPGVSWSPDSRWILVMSYRLLLVDASSGAILPPELRGLLPRLAEVE
jgi:Tol biopolymer transport system component